MILRKMRIIGYAVFVNIIVASAAGAKDASCFPLRKKSDHVQRISLDLFTGFGRRYKPIKSGMCAAARGDPALDYLKLHVQSQPTIE